MEGTYQNLLGVAYPPSKVEDVTISLDDLRCQLDTEPVQGLVGIRQGGEKDTYI